MVLFRKISSYKLFFWGLCLSQFFQPLNSTFSDFEGSLIALQVDTLSWPQVGLLKTMFLILFKMWIHGVLPFEVELPLSQLVKESRDQKGMIMDISKCNYYYKNLSYTLSSRNFSHIFPHETMIISWQKIVNGLRILLHYTLCSIVSTILS
ncbi:hypothetical protein R5R35_013866 [Gryllus longicercus]|uniref:Uncharacterized protein n=1 Tax=Gryllus longicercus TaxID=2509291 RepID=A0AAN9VJF4_9ORTH